LFLKLNYYSFHERKLKTAEIFLFSAFIFPAIRIFSIVQGYPSYSDLDWEMGKPAPIGSHGGKGGWGGFEIVFNATRIYSNGRLTNNLTREVI
jgi:hypothetical protein